jgi:hypothetical protein
VCSSDLPAVMAPASATAVSARAAAAPATAVMARATAAPAGGGEDNK